jgi:hypothetical protein
MANQITDNRTILFQANSVTADNGGRWDTLSSTSETLDTDVKIYLGQLRYRWTARY